MRNFAQLQARVANGERISPQEMAAKYEPLPADYQAVVDWLKSKGFTITRRDSHQHGDLCPGKSQPNRARPASHLCPRNVGRQGIHLGGDRAERAGVDCPAVGGDQRPAAAYPRPSTHSQAERGGRGRALYPGTDRAGLPSDRALQHEYHGRGADDSDHHWYLSLDGGRDPVLADQQRGSINWRSPIYPGGPIPTSSSQSPPSGKETLDVEWSSSIAPGAKVRVYATTDLANADLDSGTSRSMRTWRLIPNGKSTRCRWVMAREKTKRRWARWTPTTNTLWNWPTREWRALPPREMKDRPRRGHLRKPGWERPLRRRSPASDPNVIGVGGTTSEAWYEQQRKQRSRLEWRRRRRRQRGRNKQLLTPPELADGTGVASGTIGWCRIYRPPPTPITERHLVYGGSATTIGGTSWSSPDLRRLLRADQSGPRQRRPFVHRAGLGPHIYPLIGTANFRDITSGNNATASSGGLYNATTGYDEATGIGVPLVQTLAKTLAGTRP